MLDLLRRYFRGEVTTQQFRATFDTKTRTQWNVFGLKGLSGAMLLNQFVKYVPDQERLTGLLHTALLAPSDVQDARQRMGALMNFMGELRAGNVVSGLQIQTARIPFFVSALWHLQSPEQWPVYYVSGRQALEAEGLFTPTTDTVSDYFEFRTAFLSLTSALGLSDWELEHLLVWRQRKTHMLTDEALASNVATAEPTSQVSRSSPVDTPAPPTQVSTHTTLQLVLAQLGKKTGLYCLDRGE